MSHPDPARVATVEALGLVWVIPRVLNVESFWGALDEDFALGVSVQSTLASGANRVLHFGAAQWCAAKFHEDVEALIAGE